MRGPIAMVVVALCLSEGACVEPVDDAAASGSVTTPGVGGAGGAGGHTVALDTPPIELDESGNTTTDPCVATRRHTGEILTSYCARCHDGGSVGAHQGQPPFDYVLNVDKLTAATSAAVKDPMTQLPARFLTPGAPMRSRLYVRMATGEMPPRDIVGLPPNPRPSISDVSVVQEWIAHCVGARPGP
jgi:hypothetical protein